MFSYKNYTLGLFWNICKIFMNLKTQFLVDKYHLNPVPYPLESRHHKGAAYPRFAFAA